MTKFDIRKYLLESMLAEQDPTEQPVDPMNTEQPPQEPQAGQEQSPAQQSQEIETTAGVFDDYVGSVIGKIGFKRAGANGGEIEIPVKNHSVPLKISWAGNRVTFSAPDGTTVPLT